MVFCHFSFLVLLGRKRSQLSGVANRDRPPKWLHVRLRDSSRGKLGTIGTAKSPTFARLGYGRALVSPAPRIVGAADGELVVSVRGGKTVASN